MDRFHVISSVQHLSYSNAPLRLGVGCEDGDIATAPGETTAPAFIFGRLLLHAWVSSSPSVFLPPTPPSLLLLSSHLLSSLLLLLLLLLLSPDLHSGIARVWALCPDFSTNFQDDVGLQLSSHLRTQAILFESYNLSIRPVHPSLNDS